jgi:hypothetical protein
VEGVMDYKEIYERFIENYRTDLGGINLYPQFDSDLEALLDIIERDYNEGLLDR